MKRLLAIASGAVLTMVLSAGAFAANVSKTVTLEKPSQVGSTTLQPGDYKVTFDDKTPTTQVTFLKGKKTLATVPAEVKNLGSKTNNTSIVWNTQGSTPVMQEIHFGGSTQALVLQGGSSTSTSGQ